ncbi:MAG: M23 family metallopeptidase [Candidatus Peribacteraceae bacterium]|nr:M23 family metallopeptidase [Candidatus Peribacteraceae bacterium]
MPCSVLRILGGTCRHAAFTAALLVLSAIFGQSAKAQQYEYFRFPAAIGYVSHPFDDTHAASPGQYHAGIDIVTNYGQVNSAMATAYGQVWSITRNGSNDHGLGNCVIVMHAVPIDSYGRVMYVYSLYAHLATVNVTVGQLVSSYTKIGTVGGTGYGQANYWGAHLHFEIKNAGVLYNPSGSGQYWGYTPRSAWGYGYNDPNTYFWRYQAKR